MNCLYFYSLLSTLYSHLSNIPFTISGVTFPYTSPFITITGANPHAPKHLAPSIENLPSGVVSPTFIPNNSALYFNFYVSYKIFIVSKKT